MDVNTIEIQWSEDLVDDSLEWKEQCAVYMYYTDVESVYIGKTDGITSTVRIRFLKHYDDGVMDWIRENIREPVYFKVGIPYCHEKRDFTDELLDHIESILVYAENHDRDACRANVLKTKTINFHYNGRLKIVNTKNYLPLLKTYTI